MSANPPGTDMAMWGLIDGSRSTALADVDQPNYTAAVVVSADGSEHFVLVLDTAIGDDTAVYDPGCRDVEHEQLGPLPLDVVRCMTIAARTARCGRPTKAGTPCRNRVSTPGTSCTWHCTTNHHQPKGVNP